MDGIQNPEVSLPFNGTIPNTAKAVGRAYYANARLFLFLAFSLEDWYNVIKDEAKKQSLRAPSPDWYLRYSMHHILGTLACTVQAMTVVHDPGPMHLDLLPKSSKIAFCVDCGVPETCACMTFFLLRSCM